MTKAMPDRIRELARMAKASTTARRQAMNGKSRLYVRHRPDEPLTTVEQRDARLAVERLGFAVRHPTAHGTVEIDHASARVLLHATRVACRHTRGRRG